MGFFKKLFEKIFKPVEEVIEKVLEPVKDFVEEAIDWVQEKIVEPFIDKVIEPALDFALDALKASATWVYEALQPVIVKVIDTASEVTFTALLETWDKITSNENLPLNADLDRFAPVAAEEDLVVHETILSVDWSAQETITVRDAVVAAQIGYADQSVLTAAGVLDAEGYVLVVK